MATQSDGKLNALEQSLPEGLLVDAAWLSAHRYSTSLRSQYVAAGWLKQPVRQVYQRPRGPLTWQQVVISLQTLLGYNLVVGGRTALDLQGYTHYLAPDVTEVHLYGSKPPPAWLPKLSLPVRFSYHNSQALFRSVPPRLPGLDWKPTADRRAPAAVTSSGLTVQPWGQWNWPLTVSTPERAVLELLNELPRRESFHQADVLVAGLANLSPRRMEQMLADCRSVKVKRLFFFFADRHRHQWAKRIKKAVVDLGKGKRMLVKGGKLDPVYQITVPEDLDGVQ